MAIGRISGPMLFSNLERQGVDLAFQSNLLYLDVNNLRVGITNDSPQYSLDASGNVKLSKIVIQGNAITANTGKVDLGSTSNFTISGGAQNYVLSTDGSGNLTWNEVSSLDIQWGNILLANNTISIADLNGNLYLEANGAGNVITTNDFYAGNVYALNIIGSVSGNGGSFTGNVVAPYFLGNIASTTANINSIQTATGNAGVWYTADLNSTNSNITTLVATNVSAGNAVISGGYISALSNITVITGNTQSWYTTDLNSTNSNITTLVVANFSTGNAVISGGYISSLANTYITTSGITNLSTGNAVISGGYISALSNITVTTGNTESWYATALNSTDGNVTTLVATNFSSANAIITSGNVTANISGNITGTFGSFSGNVDAPWFIGNVAGTIANFLGNVYANANLAVAGNLTVSGNLTALGNVIARQITSPTGDLHFSAATDSPNNIIRFDSVSAFDIPSGTTAQRPPGPDYGYVRYNTDIGAIEWWSGSSWISGANLIVSENITPDGTNAVYTLGQTTTENAILVNINGTIQQAGSGAYSVTGNQITFSETPLVTDIIEIRYIAGGVAALTTNFANIASNVSPSANVTYDLGSSNYRWRDLWLAGNTINLGAAAISAVGNTVQLPAGSTVGGITIDTAGIQANLGAFQTYANSKIGTNTTSNLVITANTVSNSTTSGALVVKGGVGIAGNLNIGGNVDLAQSIGTPGNTASPASWLKIYVSGTEYYLPLYQ